jgi:hypothetical protein
MSDPTKSSCLSGSASKCFLVEQALAAGADLALDVIRNPGALPDRVDRDGVVLVALEGHSFSSG